MLSLWSNVPVFRLHHYGGATYRSCSAAPQERAWEYWMKASWMPREGRWRRWSRALSMGGGIPGFKQLLEEGCVLAVKERGTGGLAWLGPKCRFPSP